LEGQHLHGRAAGDVIVAARVLLVEDNPANLALMQYLLQASGYTTLTAADGREGVVVALRESPDVILMDLQMPIVDGYEAARQVKEVPALRGVPIIAVTAFAMVGDRDKILARGFDGYIAKPITPERFVSEVEGFIASALRAD
jgi:CheY-like chemotaxis protein